jgi:hypothetical protein
LLRWLESIRRRAGTRTQDLVQGQGSLLRPLTPRTRRWPFVPFQGIGGRIGDPASRAPLGLVTVALTALVVVPFMAERYTSPLFDELRTVAAPAQQLLTRVHVTLALEGAALRDFAETGDPVLAARYRDAMTSEITAEAALGELAGPLGPLVEGRYRVLRHAARRWHEVAAQVILRPAGPET